jgi:exopolysaccharide biosynthesis protein
MLICIDGRTEEAEGMSFIETQQYLFDLGCIDAINLDGGGSTTMWTKNKGVINNPSNDYGERSVANSILILENE